MVVFGLGNPGANYSGTRHNVGFDTVELIAREKGVKLRKPLLKNYRKARFGSLVLIEPLTYMNNSGLAVAGNVPDGESLVVIVDQMDLPPGRIRIRRGGSSAGHNGLKSMIEHYGPGFLRVYIGIGHPAEGSDGAEHVLSCFTGDERPLIDQAEKKAAEAVLRIYSGDKLEQVIQWANS